LNSKPKCSQRGCNLHTSKIASKRPKVPGAKGLTCRWMSNSIASYFHELIYEWWIIACWVCPSYMVQLQWSNLYLYFLQGNKVREVTSSTLSSTLTSKYSKKWHDLEENIENINLKWTTIIVPYITDLPHAVKDEFELLLNGCIMNGWIRGWMDEWKDGWTDK